MTKPEAAHLKRGQWAEDKAHQYLIKQGLKQVFRNYRCSFGEIDLIMKHQDTLVFIEVRYRKSSRYGSAAESITTAKQTKIINSANHYLIAKPHQGPIRFDAVTLSPKHTNSDYAENYQLNWVNNAFQT